MKGNLGARTFVILVHRAHLINLHAYCFMRLDNNSFA